MNLYVEWSRPILLKASRNSIAYTLDLTKVTDRPGVYIFGREWGSGFEALYVGSSKNVRSRIKGHLNNNLRLMEHLRGAKSGKRVLLAGKLVTKSGRPVAKGGQRIEKSLALTERALLRHFLSEGHDLVNKQGTLIRRHELESTGGHPKRFFPTMLYLEKTRGD